MFNNLTNRVNGLKIANPLRTLDFIEDVNIDGGTIDDYGVALNTIVGNSTNQEMLLMLPLATKVGKLYTVKGDDFVSSRASVKWVVNSKGILAEVPIDVPAIDYSSGEPRLLNENVSANELLHSNDFSNGVWNKSSSTLGASTISPDGTNNAVKLIGVAGVGFRRIYQAGAGKSISVYVKYSDVDWFMLTDGSGGSGAYFNIKNKTVGSLGANITTANIKDIGNGWLRLEITLSVVSSYAVFYQTDVDGSRNFTGDGVKGTYIYGAQLETGTEVTSYIPTTTTVKSREKDYIRLGGSVDDINSEEGLVFLRIKALGDTGLNRYITISDGTSVNRIILKFDTSNNFSVVVISTLGTGGTLTYAMDTKVIHNIAVRWKHNDYALFVDGIKVDFDLTGVTFNANTLDRLNLMNSQSTSTIMEAEIAEIALYGKGMSDDFAINLTS